MQCRKQFGVTQCAAQFLSHRTCESFVDRGGFHSEIVEVDETDVGGKEWNKYWEKGPRADRGK